MDEKNKWGEKPLHTAVNPVRDETEIDKDDTLNRDKDRMNFNIVKLLVEKGDIEKAVSCLYIHRESCFGLNMYLYPTKLAPISDF